MFIEQSQIQTLPFQFSIFYDYSTEKKKKEKKHAIFHSCLSNSSVVNVDVRMVITTTPPIGFPAESVAQGGMHLRTTVMIPPQQLWLGLSDSVCNISSWGLLLSSLSLNKASGHSRELPVPPHLKPALPTAPHQVFLASTPSTSPCTLESLGLLRQGLPSPETNPGSCWGAVWHSQPGHNHILYFFLFFSNRFLRKHLLCPKPAPDLKIKIKDFCLFIKHFSKRDYYIHIIFPCFVQTRLSQH